MDTAGEKNNALQTHKREERTVKLENKHAPSFSLPGDSYPVPTIKGSFTGSHM